MKKLFLLIVTVLFSTVLFAQQSSNDSSCVQYKHDFGLDASSLLSQFFNFNQYYYYYNPNMLTYRLYLCNNSALRLNAGANFQKANTETNDTTSYKSVNNNFKIGIGYECSSQISKRWQYFYGLDALYQYEFYDNYQEYSISNSYSNSRKTNSYGISPFFGVQFKINNRLSLSTETSYDFLYYNSEQKYSNTQYPENNQVNKENGYQSTFHSPITLHFRIKF